MLDAMDISLERSSMVMRKQKSMKKFVMIFFSLFLTLAICVAQAEEWKCPKCGRTNNGNFCPDCGTKAPQWTCPNCGHENFSAFCENCGKAKPADNNALIGKWKFIALDKVVYLTIKNETDFVLEIVEGGRIEGTYTINGIYITFSAENQVVLSGEYSISNDQFTFESLGTGVRTEEVSQFLLRMDGYSMNNILTDGDVLTVECIEPDKLARFDIVAVKYPGRGNTIFVKRLVAFQGETVELRDGYLYINGELYSEAYIADEYRTGRLNSFGPYTVPEDSYFVLGDHRNNSNDSRSVKALPSELMVGVVTAVNGSSIKQPDSSKENSTASYATLFYPGVYVDDLHIGGMTVEQAYAALEALHGNAEYDISVAVGNEIWHINQDRVPFSRNYAEVLNKAWLFGRNNMAEQVYIRHNPVYLSTKIDYDHEALRLMADGIAKYVNREPVNSHVESFDFKTRAFTFTDEVPGVYIDSDFLYNRIAEILDSGVTSDSIILYPKKTEAEVSKQQMEERFGLVSTYTVLTNNDTTQNSNVKVCTSAINGITILPGETFSFNATTGERNQENGYLFSETESVDSTVSQVSSALFCAVLQADLEIIERNPCTQPPAYIDKGLDARVLWPGIDFRFKNNTDMPVFIISEYENGEIKIELYGKKLESNQNILLESKLKDIIPQPEGVNYVINNNLPHGESRTTIVGREGYIVETWKVWLLGETAVKEELIFTTTYRAYQETVEYNPEE